MSLKNSPTHAQGVTLSSILRTGPWKLTDLKDVPKNGLKVFSCFHCGGGSSMGYKLAGFDVLGGVEIDPEMMAIYKANHSPRFSYLMGVQEFKNIPDAELPAELFNLDILDGSPPCSSFSTSGSREKKWGKATHFREGQAVQVLDDLFFDFIDIAKKLQPKVVVAENVKGLIMGKARGYVKEIFAAFRAAGYEPQLFLLNASRMGVPQARERTFFIANRIDAPKLKLEFSEPPMTVRDAFNGIGNAGKGRPLTAETTRLYNKIKPGQSLCVAHHKGSRFGEYRLDGDAPAGTLTSNGRLYHYEDPRHLSSSEFSRLQSFPDDYNFLKTDAAYLCGMSVPPFMMQRVADQIAKQWFNEAQRQV